MSVYDYFGSARGHHTGVFTYITVPANITLCYFTSLKTLFCPSLLSSSYRVKREPADWSVEKKKKKPIYYYYYYCTAWEGDKTDEYI